MAVLRVQTEDGRVVDLLPGGTQIELTEEPEDLLVAVIARLRASNRESPARPKSLAITHAEESLLWLRAYAEGRVR